MAQIFPCLAVGAAYGSEIWMSKFDKYKGVITNGGDFNFTPHNFSIGVKYDFNPMLTFGFDFQRVYFNTIPFVGNRQSISLSGGPLLGAKGSSGFHWKNQNAYKFGVEVKPMDGVKLRAGWNYGKSPIGNTIEDITLNLVAPGVVEHHLTLGGDYAFCDGKAEIQFFYMHAFKNSVSGPSVLAQAALPSGTEKMEMYQNSFGLGFSWLW